MPRPYVDPAESLAELEYQLQFVPGLVVRINTNFAPYTTEDVFVVTKINPKRVSVAPIGGASAGLNVPFRGLTIVPIDYEQAKASLVAA